MRAMSMLMPGLAALSGGSLDDGDFVLATVTHAALGEEAFGIAPGIAEIWVTLRTMTDGQMQALPETAAALVCTAAEADELGVHLNYNDTFNHCDNHHAAAAFQRSALDAECRPPAASQTLRHSV